MYAASVSIRACYFPAMAGRGCGKNKYASLGDVHEREEPMYDEQLTICLQCIEEQPADQFERFEEQINAQIGALSAQLATMGVAIGRHHQPNACIIEVDDDFIVEEAQFQLKELRLDAWNQLRAALTCNTLKIN
jgi:hypothetical protein